MFFRIVPSDRHPLFSRFMGENRVGFSFILGVRKSLGLRLRIETRISVSSGALVSSAGLGEVIGTCTATGVDLRTPDADGIVNVVG